MLKNLRELFEEDDQEFETLEDARRRTIMLAAVIGGGILFLVLLCFAGYSLFLGPRRAAARQTQVAENQTQIAVINLGEGGSASPENAVPETQPPAPTRTRIPSRTPSPSVEPSPSPTSLETATPARPTATQPPTATATPTSAPTTTPEIVFQEDFEGSGGAWPSADEDTYSYGTADGGFRIFVDAIFVDIWSVREREFADVRLELDVAQVAGPENGFAGLVCRFQNSANYYGFVVSGDGSARIFRKSGGVFNDLGDPAPRGSVRSGDVTNRIRADCTGNVLALFVNGQMVAQVEDDFFTDGLVGLVAGTQDLPGMEVLFDNFVIANP